MPNSILAHLVPTLDSSWKTDSRDAGVTHTINPPLLMKIDELHYGTPDNEHNQVSPNPDKNV